MYPSKTSQLETFLAIMRINFNISDLEGVLDNNMISDSIIERFKTKFITPEYKQIYYHFSNMKIHVNSESI